MNVMQNPEITKQKNQKFRFTKTWFIILEKWSKKKRRRKRKTTAKCYTLQANA